MGKYVTLTPLDSDAHGRELSETVWKPTDEGHWTYLPYSRPDADESFQDWLKQRKATRGEYTYTVLASPAQRGVPGSHDTTQQAVGVLTLMRLDLDCGVVEIGHVLYSPLLQRTRTGTEAVFLLLQYALGPLLNRRVEWKADNLNLPSKRAAQRFGFHFEGVFRKHRVYKGRSRDTAWLSIVDDDWPLVREAFEQWLQPTNFDKRNKQIRDLASIREELLSKK